MKKIIEIIDSIIASILYKHEKTFDKYTDFMNNVGVYRYLYGE